MAKQKHNIAHGIIEFTSEGLRQVKNEFKELEKEIKGFKSGDVIDRNKAMAALRLIDQTSAAYKELEKALQGVGGKVKVNADLQKQLADPTLNKVLKTYLAMGPALRSAGKELQVVARLQKNLSTTVGGTGGDGLSYRYMQEVPGRANSIKERQLDRGRLDDNLTESLKARVEEIKQVFSTKGGNVVANRLDLGKEIAIAVDDEFKRVVQARREQASFATYGVRKMALQGQLSNGKIGEDEFYSQMRKIEQDKEFDMSMANSATSRGMSRGYYADFDPAMKAGSISSQIENQRLDESAKLRAFSEAAVDMANAIRMKVTELRTVHLDKELEDLFRKMENKSIDPYEFQKGAENVINKKQASFAVSPLLQKIQAPADEVDEDLAKAQMQQKEFEEGLKSLTDLSGGLTEKQDELVKTSRDMLQTNVDNAKAAVPLKERMDEIKSQTSALAAKRARGIKLTKDEIKITERLGAEYSVLQSKVRVLTAGVNGHNVALHEGAVSSRRYNYMLQQASYGVQDFVQVIGQTGLSGALRASANNVAAVFGAMGNTGGALAGAGITILMIGIADAAKSLGLESETAAEKMEKLNRKLETFLKYRSQMANGRLEIIGSKDIAGKRTASDASSAANAVLESKGALDDRVSVEKEDFLGNSAWAAWDAWQEGLMAGIVSIPNALGAKQKKAFDFDLENLGSAKLRGDQTSVTGISDRLSGVKGPKRNQIDRMLNADASTPEGVLQILEVMVEIGQIKPEKLEEAKEKFKQSMQQLDGMTRLMKEETQKVLANISKFESLNVGKVSAGDLSVFDTLREAREAAIEELEKYDYLINDAGTPEYAKKRLREQRDEVDKRLVATNAAEARLQAKYVAPSRSAQAKDIMSSVGDITASKASPFEKSQRLREFSQQFNESSKDFGAGRRFGRSKSQSITDTQNEMNAYRDSLTDPAARAAVDDATIRLIESMENSRDDFEEFGHQMDQFIKRAKESDIFTVDMKEAVSGAREFAEKTKPLLEEIDKLKQDLANTTDLTSQKEIKLQIASKQAAVNNFSQAAQAKLISAVSSGPKGILGGILQGVEDASVERNSLIKGGAARADADAAATGIMEQQAYDAVQGFSGKFAVKPGETQEEARMRFAQEADAAVATARQKEGTGELAAGTADIIKESALMAIDKSLNQRQQVGVTSAENMWSSIQTSLSSPENYDKSQLDELRKVSQNTADVVTALKNGFTL